MTPVTRLNELEISSVVKVNGHRAIVINPHKGVVATLGSDNQILHLDPESPITHHGRSCGGLLRWQAVGSTQWEREAA